MPTAIGDHRQQCHSNQLLVDLPFPNLFQLRHFDPSHLICQPKQQLRLLVDHASPDLFRLHSHNQRHLICPQLMWSKHHDVPTAIELHLLCYRHYLLNHCLQCCLYQCLPRSPRVGLIRRLSPRPGLRIRVRRRQRLRS